MELHTTPQASASEKRRPVTIRTLARRRRRGEPVVMVTAYDAPTARVVDAAGADVILVGDSLGMVVLGYDSTLQVTMEDMVRHTAAVARTRPRALVVADLPFLSYHASHEQAVLNAGRLVQDGGADCVKIEGGARMGPTLEAIVGAQVPVMAHIGLTPQSVKQFGGYRVQGRGDASEALVDDARAVEAAGAFALVLEGVPSPVGKAVTEAVSIPVIGIGAGPDTTGQVLVFHDLVGLSGERLPRFVKRYANLEADMQKAVARFVADVQSGAYPASEHCYE